MIQPNASQILSQQDLPAGTTGCDIGFQLPGIFEQMPQNPMNVTQYRTLRTDKVIRYDELDQGFILRANEEVTKQLRKLIKYGVGSGDQSKEVKENADSKNEDAQMDELDNDDDIVNVKQDVDVQDDNNEEGHEKPEKKKKDKKKSSKQQPETQGTGLDLISFLPHKRLYGLKINNCVYLATLVDLPCIVEAMKTLDFFNFYKSQDASQMLYVHPRKIENFDSKSRRKVRDILEKFNPLEDDPQFIANLYQRAEIVQRMKEFEAKMQEEQKEDLVKEESNKNSKKYNQYAFEDETLKFRHGISPVAFNIRNQRHKRKPTFDTKKVKRVENILKDLIELGFSEHVDEQLLDFDEDGELKNVIDGKNERKAALGELDDVRIDDIIKDDDDSDDSDPTSMLDDGLSSIYANQSLKNKSTKKSDLISDIGTFNKVREDDSPLESASVSISNQETAGAKFKHLTKSDQKMDQDQSKPSNAVVSQLTVPIGNFLTNQSGNSQRVISAKDKKADSNAQMSQQSKEDSVDQSDNRIVFEGGEVRDSSSQISLENGIVNEELKMYKKQKEQLRKLLNNYRLKIIDQERNFDDSSMVVDLKKEMRFHQNRLEEVKLKIKNLRNQQ